MRNILKHQLLLIIVISLVMQFMSMLKFDIPLERDATTYYQVGKSLAAGKGFTNADGTPSPLVKPLYCLFLAAIFAIFPAINIGIVRLFQALFIALTCFIIVKIAREAFGEKTGFWSGVFMAVYPPFWIISSSILPESLFTFLLALAVYLLVAAIKKNKMLLFLCSGLVFGLSTQARPTSIMLPLFISAALFVFIRERSKYLKGFILVIAITFLAVIPWTVRNYVVFKVASPSIELGEVFWIGTYTKGACSSDNVNTRNAEVELRKERSRHSFAAGSKLRVAQAFLNIKGNLFMYIVMFPVKFLRLWLGSYAALFGVNTSFSQALGMGNPATRDMLLFICKLFSLLLSMGVLIFGLAGMFSTRSAKNFTAASVVLLVFIYFSLVHMVLIAESRYGIPGLPYLIAFAVSGFIHFIHKGGENAAKE